MKTEQEGFKRPFILNIVPLFTWLWRTDRVQKLVRKIRRK